MKNKSMNNRGRRFGKSSHSHSHSHSSSSGNESRGGHRPQRNASSSREKYLAMARDAMASGDRVLAENYFQHADHYFRMMLEDGSHMRSQQGHMNNGHHRPQGDAQPMQAEHMPEQVVETALPAFVTNPPVERDGNSMGDADYSESQKRSSY